MTSLRGNFCLRASSCLILGESHLDPDKFRDDCLVYSSLALIVRLPSGLRHKKINVL